jgi:hypothetical protein
METLNLITYPQERQTKETYSNPQKTLENALDTIFPQQIEENKVLSVRRILGETGKSFSDEQIECLVTDFQFLIDTWLDEFESHVFEGKTLKELLGEKEYAATK